MALLFTAVRVVLGLFFLFMGAVKLTEQISAELYLQMKSQFVQFADVFPLKEFGYKPEPDWYLEVVGWIEVVAGLLLAFGPQLLQEISNFVLTIIMIAGSFPSSPVASTHILEAGRSLTFLLMFHLHPSGTEGAYCHVRPGHSLPWPPAAAQHTREGGKGQV